MPKRKSPPPYYAVAVGQLPGIYETWSEAKQQVDEFPGRKYKSFPTRLEATQYLRDNDVHVEPDEDGDVDDITRGLSGVSFKDAWRSAMMEKHKNALVAFCAVSAPSNGQEDARAAYAVFFPEENVTFEDNVLESPTNYHGDCLAVQKATELADELDVAQEQNLVIYTNCDEVVKAMSGQTRWVNKWQRNGWRTSNKDPVKYPEIFRVLLEAESRRQISWHHLNTTTSPEWAVGYHRQAKQIAQRKARQDESAAA